MNRYKLAAIVGCLTFLLLPAAQAQEFPTRAVKLVVGYPAGGFVDPGARIVAQELSELWKQPVIVENRPGASGTLAVREVLDAEPDGYTILVGANSELTVIQYTKQVNFTVADFNPIGKIASAGVVIAAAMNTPFNTIREFGDYAKKQTNPVQYGTPGPGTTNQVVAEWLADALGIKLQHVPYRGGSQAVTAAVAGEMPLVFLSIGVTKPQADAGKLKLLATSSPERAPSAPNMPTLKENNIPVVFTNWIGLFTPKKVPEAINERIYAGLKHVLESPTTAAKFAAQGLEVKPLTTRAVFSQDVLAEAAENKVVIEKSKIVAE